MSARQPPPRARIDWSQVNISRGALILLGIQVGLSLVWLFADAPTRLRMLEWIAPSQSQVLDRGRVWTLATGPLIEPEFLGLLLNGFMLWTFVPRLERFWGTPRFFRFVAITSIAGSVGGVLMGRLTMQDQLIVGLTPFILASMVAFGIIYARQPVQFFGRLPLTGRQLMWGFLAFSALFIVLQGMWERGASYAAACIASAILTSKRLSPGLAWKRWQLARKRAKLAVLEGGLKGGLGGSAGRKPAKPSTTDERFIN